MWLGVREIEGGREGGRERGRERERERERERGSERDSARQEPRETEIRSPKHSQARLYLANPKPYEPQTQTPNKQIQQAAAIQVITRSPSMQPPPENTLNPINPKPYKV